MKRSKTISLILLAPLLYSCSAKEEPKTGGDWEETSFNYRGDSTQSYERTSGQAHMSPITTFYMAYMLGRMGGFGGGMGYRSGYYSPNAASNLANAPGYHTGRSLKKPVGGFGSTARGRSSGVSS